MYYEAPYWMAFWEDEAGVRTPWCRSREVDAIDDGAHEWEFFGDLGNWLQFRTETF